MKNYSLTAILLIGLVTPGFAQTPEEIARHEAVMNSPAAQQMQLNVMKQTMGTLWNGNGLNPMTMELLQQDGIREGVGVSQEQVQRIQLTMQGIGDNMPNDPVVKPVREELERFMHETQGGPFAPNATEETQQRFFELQTNLQMTVHETALGKLQNVIQNNLTPDQLKKVREVQIAVMSDNPIVAPGMFEALDLTDAQRNQLDGIKKELEPEFKKNVDQMAQMQWKLQKKVQGEVGKKLESVTDPNERKKIVEETVKKIQESNPEFRQEMAEIGESGKEIANKLKSRMSEVLTDEQKKRMTDLIDNPPDFIKRRRGMITNSSQTGGEWRPGPDSWKPGDPIPAEYIEEQKARFPRRQ